MDVYPKHLDRRSEDEVIDVNAVDGIYGITNLMSEAVVRENCPDHLILRCFSLVGKYAIGKVRYEEHSDPDHRRRPVYRDPLRLFDRWEQLGNQSDDFVKFPEFIKNAMDARRGRRESNFIEMCLLQCRSQE